MKVQKSVEIQASKDKVWPFLVQPAKILEWYVPMQRFEYRRQQSGGVGTTIYAEEKVVGKPRKFNFVVTDWVENQRLAFKMTSGEFLRSYEQKWMVEADPQGSRLTIREDLKLPYGFLGTLMGFIAGPNSRATLGTMLTKLKAFAEQS